MVFYTAIHSPSALSIRRPLAAEHLQVSTRSVSSENASDVAESEHDETEEAGVDSKLPQVVINTFLELHNRVARREKHRRLRDDFILTAQEHSSPELNKSPATVRAGLADSEQEQLEKEEHDRYAQVHAEIAQATHPREVGVLTRKFVKGEVPPADTRVVSRNESTSCAQKDAKPSPIKSADVNGNGDSVMSIVNPQRLSSTERATLVHQLTGVSGDPEMPILINSRAQKNLDSKKKKAKAKSSAPPQTPLRGQSRTRPEERERERDHSLGPLLSNSQPTTISFRRF